MSEVVVVDWAAWSPGIASRRDWESWAQDPRPLGHEGAPEVRFLPALQRRRCDRLSRMCLQAVHDAVPEALRGGLLSVFASRHGSFENMAAMLCDLADGSPLSPNRFSHSVHNTQAGLFSIWAGNREASTCVAAGAETFGAGFLEGMGMLHRHPGAPLLLVVGDEPVPEPFDTLASGTGAYALAFLLQNGDGDAEGTRVGLRFGPGEEGSLDAFVPDGLAFLRWLISDQESLRLAHPGRSWLFARG
ncbi:MAG: beta-ketoacyl synthase chain length factor [Myxococcales bacterium]|nr:beta-ketoacyl synthase chain length factor [Myxococcales bacterium]